jgi:hypothetical protein
MQEKRQEYNETVHQPFIDFKKAYDSVGWEVLYDILIEFGVPMNLYMIRLIEMCLNETKNKFPTSKTLRSVLLKMIQQEDSLRPLIFSFVLAYIRKVQENQVGLTLNGTRQLLIYAGDVNPLEDNTNTINKNKENLIHIIKEVGPEVNA